LPDLKGFLALMHSRIYKNKAELFALNTFTYIGTYHGMTLINFYWSLVIDLIG
jgi:hypothetical protein